MKPGLLLSVAPEAGASEGELTVLAARAPVSIEDPVAESFGRPATGLFFPHRSIVRLGLEARFLALFDGTLDHIAVVAVRAPPRLVVIAQDMLSPPIVGDGGRLLLGAHATEILAHALFGRRADRGPPAAPGRMRLQAVKDAINADLRHPWSIAELAECAGLGRRTFNQQFRMAFGVSAADYLRNLRLDVARELLIHRQLSVTEAAYRVGYAHPANFATAFRKRFGHAPSRRR
ncbi:helix-turn-helix transcriptional regulator [Bradyrhizobium jicamae]|nr:helix-turn-helix transcriptional regulator [Bradyrhizobium jicamae]